jgi:succinate dehydrogenase / fumarate reductase iron-sulfur subunit
MKLRFKIFRFDPDINEKPYFENHSIDVDNNMRILDCLNQIRWEHDPSLSYRWSCSHGICGSDGMTINGTAALACQKLVKDFKEEDEIILEPLSFFPIIKDLIVDMEPFFERMRSIHPEGWGKFSPVDLAKEIHQSPTEHAEIVDTIKCVMCGCCTASCPVNRDEDSEYIGPAAVLRAKRYIFDTRLKETQERMKIVEKPHGVWSCMTYWECTNVCPKNIQVTQNILNLKTKLLKQSSRTTQ